MLDTATGEEIKPNSETHQLVTKAQKWFKKDNFCHYSTEWQPYIMDYDKFEYDIKLKDGSIYCNCYPNAQKFNSIDPKYKNGASGQFHESLIAEIRFTPKDKQKWEINPDECYEPPTL